MSLAREVDEDGEVELVPKFGPLNAERLSDYQRLDLRASRTWSVALGQLSFFIEVQNVFDHENLAGYDLEVDEDEGVIITNSESWPGFLPSVGLNWEF